MIQIILTKNEISYDVKYNSIDDINSIDQFIPTLYQAIAFADVVVYRDDSRKEFKVLKHKNIEMVGQIYHVSMIKNILFGK